MFVVSLVIINVVLNLTPFGFSVKDYHTKQTLLRCDNTGDLYPVTTTYLQSFHTIAPSLWHQCLGHPGQHVFQQLVSNNCISCKNQKESTLCHDCQLGKDVKLPFSLFTFVTMSPFQLIHLDVWTSLVESVSGIKYYVIFQDGFSHFLWVYPLHSKYEVFSKFLHFRSYVQTQFKCDVQYFNVIMVENITTNNFEIFVILMGLIFDFPIPIPFSKMVILNECSTPLTMSFVLFYFMPTFHPHIGWKPFTWPLISLIFSIHLSPK